MGQFGTFSLTAQDTSFVVISCHAFAHILGSFKVFSWPVIKIQKSTRYFCDLFLLLLLRLAMLEKPFLCSDASSRVMFGSIPHQRKSFGKPEKPCIMDEIFFFVWATTFGGIRTSLTLCTFCAVWCPSELNQVEIDREKGKHLCTVLAEACRDRVLSIQHKFHRAGSVPPL